MSLIEIRRELQRRFDVDGGRTISTQCGLMPCIINDMIVGARSLDDRVLKALGYSRVTRYEKVGE